MHTHTRTITFKSEALEACSWVTEDTTGILSVLTISMMRWPHTKHLSAVCWKPEYCKEKTQRLLSAHCKGFAGGTSLAMR